MVVGKAEFRMEDVKYVCMKYTKRKGRVSKRVASTPQKKWVICDELWRDEQIGRVERKGRENGEEAT